MKDGVLESLVIGAASWARGIRVFGPPRGVGGKIAFVGAHLVEASCNKLLQAHEWVRVMAAGEDIVVGGWVEGVPLA